jgi:hypothetical protein
MAETPATRRPRLTLMYLLQREVAHAQKKGAKYVMIDRQLAEDIVLELERIDAERVA